MKNAAKEALNSRDTVDYTSFSDYQEKRCKVWILEETSDTQFGSDFFCNCPVGMKGKICKHTVGLLYKNSLLEITEEVRNKPLGVKRKRGRPKKTAAPLVRQIE